MRSNREVGKGPKGPLPLSAQHEPGLEDVAKLEGSAGLNVLSCLWKLRFRC